MFEFAGTEMWFGATCIVLDGGPRTGSIARCSNGEDWNRLIPVGQRPGLLLAHGDSSFKGFRRDLVVGVQRLEVRVIELHCHELCVMLRQVPAGAHMAMLDITSRLGQIY